MVALFTFALRFFTFPLCLDSRMCLGDFPSEFVTTAALSFITL